MLRGWVGRTRQTTKGYKHARNQVDPSMTLSQPPEDHGRRLAPFVLEAETIYWVCTDLPGRCTRLTHQD
jgi:hypothetical protein